MISLAAQFLTVLTFLIIPIFLWAQSARYDEARKLVERYEAALIAGDMSRLDEIRAPEATLMDIDFVRQRTPGGIRVVSSTVRGQSSATNVFYVDVYRELVDKENRTVKVYGANHLRISVRENNGVLRVSGRSNLESWYTDSLISASRDEDLAGILNSYPEYDLREALIRAAYQSRISGDLEGVKVVIDVCRRIARFRSDDAFLARCELNHGLLLMHQGRFRESLTSLILSENLSISSGDGLGRARTLVAMGDLHAQQGNAALSRSLHEKALSVLNSSKIGEIDARVVLNGVYMGLATAAIANGDLKEAISHLEKEIGLGMRFHGIPDYNAELLLAKVLIRNGDVERGALILQSLEQYARQRIPSDTSILSRVLIEMATLKLERQNEPSRAAAMASEAIALSEGSSDPTNTIRGLTILGRAHAAIGSTSDALSAFRSAIELVEEGRLSVVGEREASHSFFGERRRPYEELASLLARNGKFLESLSIAEQSKARTLADAISSRSGRTEAATANSGDIRLAALKDSLSSANRDLLNARQNPKSDTQRLRDLAAVVEKARIALEDHLARSSLINLNSEKGSDHFKPINEAQLLALFPNDRTAFLEYVVTAKEILVYLVTRHGGKTKIEFRSISVQRKELEQKISAFRAKIQHADLTYRADASDLFRVLVSAALRDLKGIDALVIIPDSIIWDVPFQALVSESSRFLIEDFNISYAPSLKALHELQRVSRGVTTNPQLLALANPIMASKSVSSVERMRGERLEPLASAEREVDALSKIFGRSASRIYKRRTATESVFRSIGKEYTILHFATHGLLNSRNPMYSALVLAPTDGLYDDGLVEAWELMGMQLNADLAVLSACETARGNNIGEGLVGLSWAFFIAGVPRVVASQWRVESFATSDLMIRFYRQIVGPEGRNVSNALRSAMISKIRSTGHKHPFYWAGFIVVGVY